MIRKYEKLFKRYVTSSRVDSHIEWVKKTTWWFLFIPVFSYERIYRTNTDL